MSTSAVATPSKLARHLPGEAGIWLFIFGDMMVFSLFFIVFIYSRGKNIELYNTSQAHLSQFMGVFNTFYMLTSSVFVVTAIRAARKNMGKVTSYCFIMAWLCGLGFVVNKYFEYGEKIRAGITLNSSGDFFMYYYMFTGIHLMHVFIGMGVLAWTARYSWTEGFDEKKMRNLESAGSFWHVVDLLWIVLFALLYLVK